MGSKLKKIFYTALTAATLLGTFGGKNEGCLPPLYTHKTGTGYGINVGVLTSYAPNAKFYGIDLSAVTYNKGKKNGAFLALFNVSGNGKINGLQAGLANFGDNDPPMKSDIINGVQIGLFNYAKAGNLIQIGGINGIKIDYSKSKWSLGLNSEFSGLEKGVSE